MEIQEGTKSIKVYTVGNKEFLNIKEAEAYLQSIKALLKYKYHYVVCAPDLTEGRGYHDHLIVAVPLKSCKNTLVHYLTKTLGDPLQFVMEVDPMNNWMTHEERVFDNVDHLKEFLSTKRHIGDTRKYIPPVVFIDESGKCIVDQEAVEAIRN